MIVISKKLFDKIKRFLQNLPQIAPPVLGKPIILYLIVTEIVIGYVLSQHDEFKRKEQAIYYLSKKLNDCESQYIVI